tara:strand:- start:1067 stop:3082 length:2016 start_codon:yes stop_codon:yes gene_type:complete
MHIETLAQPIFFVYILFFLVQICAISSPNKLISSLSCSLFFLGFSFLLFLVPLGERYAISVTNILAILSFVFVCKITLNINKINLRELSFPLILSFLSGIFISLQPAPFQYPGDISTYLNNFISLSLDSVPQNNCFSFSLIPKTYDSSCTLVKTLLSIGKINTLDLINAYPQRLFLGLEVSIMSLSYYRLLLPLKLTRIALALSWLILLFGLGNQSILFVLNHALQGSILAATIFMEIACFSYLILIQKHGPQKFFAFLSVICVGVLIQLRIHGAFSMASLIFLIPFSLLLGLYCLFVNNDLIKLSRRNIYFFISSSCLITIFMIFNIFGWSINHVSTRSIVFWNWLERFNLPLHSLPASYILKTPVSRPESLAVISLIIGLIFLCFSRSELFKNISHERKVFALLTSIFSLSIVFAYLIPPISNLFLNINASDAAATHYRLMWSSEIFSPLPLFINAAVSASYKDKIMRLIFVAASALIFTIVLVPIPNLNTSSKYPQFLWSKTKQIFQVPSDQVDQTKIVKSLLPVISSLQGLGNQSTLIADEIINFSLYPYSNLINPLNPPRRIFKLNELNINSINYPTDALTEEDQKEWILSLKSKPDCIIQQEKIGEYYSPYSEIGVYDLNIADSISRQIVNTLSENVLKESGYILTKSNSPFYKIWYRESSLNNF